MLLAYLIHRCRLVSCCSGLLIGVVLMASVGHWQVNWQLPEQEISKIKRVTGTIESVVTDPQQPRFNFLVSDIDGEKKWISPRIRLSWRDPAWQPKQGQKASFLVKLKPLHGLANQGGFRYQQWLMSQRIVATGYIKAAELDTFSSRVTRRQKWLDNLYLLPLKNKAWIAALTYGDKSLFSVTDWHLIQSTGIAHLVAISGLHLGTVALLVTLVFSAVLKLSKFILPLSQTHNYRFWLVGVVVMTTGYYAYIAGFSLPTLRAWLMLLLLSALIVTHRAMTGIRFLLVSIVCFLLIQPLSILSLSFWLSFGAIMAIGFILWRWPLQHNQHASESYFSACIAAIKKMTFLQMLLSLLMLPLVASQFSVIAVQSPFINLVAIPVVTFCLVPLCLLAALVISINTEWASNLFQLIDVLIDYCLHGLMFVQHFSPLALTIPGIAIWHWLLVLIVVGLLLLPISHLKKGLTGLCLLPMLTNFLMDKATDWQLHVLDVGQGTAVVIQKNSRALVYDVGNRFSSGFNMADAVILPFLKHSGIKQLDWVLISHFDNDHAGSLANLFAGITVNRFASNQDICQRGWQLTWQKLQLQALWPTSVSAHKNNDSSCVISIADGRYRVLLTGDISATVEQMLVNQQPDNLHANILLAAHHGSSTSSSNAFIHAVSPEYAVFSQGFRNRWGFPKQQVINRFIEADVRLYSTAESGQISFSLDPYQGAIEVQTFRQHMLPTWYNRYLWQ
jgi:competence protein ComEC